MRIAIITAAITLISPLATVQAQAPASRQFKPGDIGIVEGGQQARHRLTIVSAYSCPYCRVLDDQAMTELRRRWVPRGLQIESVPVVISPTDVAASIAAVCGAPHGYARRSTILFRAQPEILGNWRGADQSAKDRATAMPAHRGALQIARLSGVLALAPSLGLSDAQLSGCLSDPAMQRRVQERGRRADARWNVGGTPTVFIDDRKVGSTWDDVRRTLVRLLG